MDINNTLYLRFLIFDLAEGLTAEDAGYGRSLLKKLQPFIPCSQTEQPSFSTDSRQLVRPVKLQDVKERNRALHVARLKPKAAPAEALVVLAREIAGQRRSAVRPGTEILVAQADGGALVAGGGWAANFFGFHVAELVDPVIELGLLIGGKLEQSAFGAGLHINAEFKVQSAELLETVCGALPPPSQQEYRGRVSHSTLADANQNRDWRIYHGLAQTLIQRARLLDAKDDFGLQLDQTIYALDSTTIDLCLNLFPWGAFAVPKPPSNCTLFWICVAPFPYLSRFPMEKWPMCAFWMD